MDTPRMTASSLPADLTLRLVRDVPISPEACFEAWTVSKRLMLWFCPRLHPRCQTGRCLLHDHAIAGWLNDTLAQVNKRPQVGHSIGSLQLVQAMGSVNALQ